MQGITKGLTGGCFAEKLIFPQRLHNSQILNFVLLQLNTYV